jgi:RNA polymerase sigma-70 factor (ECF subfamily)
LLVALSDYDRTLLDQCLARQPGAWKDFVGRFAGLVVHVINHTARCRSLMLSAADRDDLAAEVFFALVQDDFAVLRRFQRRSSLATYLTVVARRVVVRKLLARRGVATLDAASESVASSDGRPEQRIADREEVERLLGTLHGAEAEVVRMYHLEGKTYQEISGATGVAANSLGPMLSRARAKLRASSEI